MTEAEWLECADPTPMLENLRDKASARKLRLFAVASCRRVLHLLHDERNRNAIHVVEGYAEGLFPKKRMKATRRQTYQVRAERPNLIGHDYRWGPAYAEAATDALTLGPNESAMKTASHVATALAYGPHATSDSPRSPQYRQVHEDERRFQADLLRHIVGNPFRGYPAPEHWPATVVQVAHALYCGQECDFALRDALLDAGHADLAQHFREEKEHPKGCWVIDLVLGKK